MVEKDPCLIMEFGATNGVPGATCWCNSEVKQVRAAKQTILHQGERNDH